MYHKISEEGKNIKMQTFSFIVTLTYAHQQFISTGLHLNMNNYHNLVPLYSKKKIHTVRISTDSCQQNTTWKQSSVSAVNRFW